MFFKILCKVFINRLKPILPSIIHSTQSAFVQGRFITDNALLVYECLHNLRVKKTGKKYFATLKLDMSKAYDRVEWSFIKNLMLKLSFKHLWVQNMMNCVRSV